MRFVPLSPESWTTFCSWHNRAGSQIAATKEAIMVADGDLLLAGACLFPTDSVYLFAEHLATNPDAPLRKRHAAVCVLVDELRRYAAVRGKFVMVVIRHRSLAKMLERVGFTRSQGVVMFAPPVAEAPERSRPGRREGKNTRPGRPAHGAVVPGRKKRMPPGPTTVKGGSLWE